MSWGVATQNGVSVSLASIVSLSAGVTEFSPIDLFTGGTVGAWYDPSDYTTLFQDSAGTTAVTAVEQPVGLMLDKSQGLVLGSDVVVNGDFATDTNWTKAAGWTISGGSANLIAGGYPIISQNFSYTIGTWYQVTFTVTNRVSAIVQFLTSPGRQKGPQTSVNGTYTFLFLASAGDTYIGIQDQNGIGSLSIDNLIVKALPGNHASQATSTSRPVLRARYNLLTYSEQFDNAAYTKSSVTLTTNATTAPDGTATAEKMLATAGNARHAVYPSGVTASGTCVASIYVKYDNHAFFQIGGSSGGFYANFNVQTGVVGTSGGARYLSHAITSVGSGWYRLSVVYTNSSDGPWFQQVSSASDGLLPFWTAAGTESTFIWGAQVDNAPAIGTYQRIAAATDYATAGFLPYLAFDGTDDSFGTNSINFSATDKMSVCAGVTKLSDGIAGNYGCIAELSADAGANLGTFNLFGPAGAPGGTPDFGFSSKGSLQATAVATGNAAPVTRVLTGQGDIAADVCVLRVNAANAATSSSDQGTGNFGNYPLYIGRRNNSLYPFNGRIYQMVVCGKTLSAAELASTEAYVNSKTGAY